MLLNLQRIEGQLSGNGFALANDRKWPPPIFLQSRPELGDVSKGQLLTIKNFFSIFNGILTPVHMEGLRLLLEQFRACGRSHRLCLLHRSPRVATWREKGAPTPRLTEYVVAH